MSSESKGISEHLVGILCREECLEEVPGDLAEYKEKHSTKPKWQHEIMRFLMRFSP